MSTSLWIKAAIECTALKHVLSIETFKSGTVGVVCRLEFFSSILLFSHFILNGVVVCSMYVVLCECSAGLHFAFILLSSN